MNDAPPVSEGQASDSRDLEWRIRAQMADCASMAGARLVEPITDDTVLLESGLDSLGFATLVVSLEEELGYDPFAMRQDVVYPRTFGEFVSIYRDAAAHVARDGSPG